MGYVWFTGIFGKTTTGVETGVERTGETLGTRFIIESAYNYSVCTNTGCAINASIRNTGTELLDLTTLVAYVDERPQDIDVVGNKALKNAGTLGVGETIVIGLTVSNFNPCGKVLRLTAAPQAEASETIVCS
jgi:hypothetical protein